MLTVVMDTNVFVSAVISSRSAPAQLLSHWQSGLFDLISCQKAIAELDEVLRRPHLVEKYSIDKYKRETLLGIVRERVILSKAIASKILLEMTLKMMCLWPALSKVEQNISLAVINICVL